MSTGSEQLFRKEVLDHAAAGPGREGRVLRVHPGWTTWSFWLLLGVMVGGTAFMLIGRVHQYTRGYCVIRVEGRTLLTAANSGTITSIGVRPGQRVAAGEVLVHLDEARERGELDRIERELDLQTRRLLTDVTDDTARHALTVLRADYKLAEAALETRCIRAPQDGVVSDLRIRVGQQLSTGQVVLSLLPSDAKFHVVGLLPGESRPMLQVGDTLRLELDGYRYVYQHFRIESVGDQVIGPQEAYEYLGPDVADAISLTGPVVLVETRTHGHTFVAEGREYEYYDGMLGTAHVRLRSQNILVSLVPGLKSLVREIHE